MAKNPFFFSISLLILALSAGCASTTASQKATSPSQPASAAAPDSNATDLVSPTKKATIEQPKKTIAPDTLYDLLIAEMGGKVNRLEIALGHYMRQAHLTQDPAVIERYTRIASYMQAHQATLDATKLWLSTDPENIDALHFMLNHQIKQGTSKRQKAALLDILAQTDQLNLLVIEQQLNQTPKEQRQRFHDMLERLITKDKALLQDNDQLWYLKAKTNSLNSQHEQVIEDIKILQKLKADFLPGYVLQVDAYEKMQQYDKAEKSIKKLIALDPNNKKIRIYHTRLLIKERQFEKANTAFEELLELYPDDLDLKITAGILAAQTKRYPKALALFQTLIDAQYRTNEANIQIALVHAAQKDSQQAIAYFLKVTPSQFYQEARFNAAQLLVGEQQTSKAIEILEQAAQAQPTFKHVYTITIAEILSEQGQLDQALDSLNQGIKQHPEEASLFYSRAIILGKLQKFAQSEADFRQVLQLKPQNIAALNALGYTLAERNVRLDEARELLEKAISLSPNDPPILDSLGWLEFRSGELQKAKQYLSKAFSLLEDHEIAAHYGEVLWVLGEEKEALSIWRKGLELKPDSTIIQETKQRLLK